MPNNTCILFFELFMCKVLKVGFFYYKVMIYFFIFFDLSLGLETNQASQPLALPCPPNLVQKDKEWTKVGSKWKCKVGTYIVAYCANWLLTKHLKQVHGLVVEKAKLGRPSISERGPRRQDHVKMNACILGNIMVMQRWNDQKVTSHAHAKTQREWDKLATIVEQCPPFLKPTLVKLTSE